MDFQQKNYSQDLQQLLQEYQAGKIHPKRLERVIHKIARQHARREANRNNTWMIGGFLGMFLLQFVLSKLPNQSQLALSQGVYQGQSKSQESSATTPIKEKLPEIPPTSSRPLTTEPLEIYTPFLIDNSPKGAWDFTFKRHHNAQVEVPSPCTGEVRRVYFQGKTGNLKTGKGGGQIVEINCAHQTINRQPYGWVIAHLELNPPVQAGQTVLKGETIGIQGMTGRTSGYHVHAQFHYQKDWKRITDRTVTRPHLEEYFTFVRSGQQDS